MLSLSLRSTGLYAFEHALLHYKQGSRFDFAFAMLHADHAIELLLKAKASEFPDIQLIKKNGKSLGFYDVIVKLKSKGIVIPEEANLGKFHELRNPVQHIGEFVDRKAIATLLATLAFPFLERFTRQELGVDLRR